MAKFISNEEFFIQLNSCEYGRQYIELVTNPKNHIGKKEKGDDHHMYMKSICGDNNHLVRLSYYNHCLAHLLLAKAGCELDAWWSGKALLVINKMSGKAQYNSLTDLEKADLELEGWAEARKISNIKNSEMTKERYANNKEEILTKRFNTLAQRTPEEIEATHQKYVEVQKKRYSNPDERKRSGELSKRGWANKPEAEKQQFSDDISVRMTAWWANVSEGQKSEMGVKISKSNKERWANLPEEEKQEYIRKMTEINRNTIANRTEEKRQEICQIQKEINSRPEVKAKKSAGQVGRKVINNGIEEKRVYPHEIEYYLNLGWKIGQKCSHVKKSA